MPETQGASGRESLEEGWGERYCSPSLQGGRVRPQQAERALRRLGPGCAVLCVLLAAPHPKSGLVWSRGAPPPRCLSPASPSPALPTRPRSSPAFPLQAPPLTRVFPPGPAPRPPFPSRPRPSPAFSPPGPAPHLRFPTRPCSSRCSRALSLRRLSSLVNVPSECRGALRRGREGGRGWSGPGRGRMGCGGGSRPRGRRLTWAARGARRSPRAAAAAAAAAGPVWPWCAPDRDELPRGPGPFIAAPGAGARRAGGRGSAPPRLRAARAAPHRSRGKVRAAPPAVAPAARPPLAPRWRPSAGRRGSGARGPGDPCGGEERNLRGNGLCEV